MFDPTNKQSLLSLTEALLKSRELLEPFRAVYKSAVEQMVGTYYSNSGADKPVPLNLIELAIRIYQRALLPKSPQIAVHTRDQRVRPAGTKLAGVVNRDLYDESIMSTLFAVNLNALFGVGLIKIGVEPDDDFSVGETVIAGTKPFIVPILLDDWVHDMSARSMEETSYRGHRYRIPLEEAMKDETFDPESRQRLQVSEWVHGNDSRVSEIQGKTGLPGEFGKLVELWEIYLPADGMVLTLSDDFEILLKVVEWRGPKHGPFRWLSFQDVPGNTMPISPAMGWQSLHRMVNGLMRKLDRQAKRQKNIGVTRGENTGDAEKARTCSDGDVVALDDPNALQEKSYGGIDQQSFAWMLQLFNLFKSMAGNLDVLGGLATGSETVGQDKILNANINSQIEGMTVRVMEFLRWVLTDYAYWVWMDPYQAYETEIVVEGYSDVEGPVTTQLTPEERSHPFFLHELIIEPHSMVYQTPQQKAAILDQVIATAAPFAPMMEAQGLAIDMKEYFRLKALFTNVPEIADVITANGQKLDLGGSIGRTEMRQSPMTHRVNERVSSSRGPAEGNASMIQQLMSGGQEAQMPQGMGA